MSWEPRKEVVDSFARWLFRRDHPDVLDWEAEEADPSSAPVHAPAPDGKTEYEQRARAMLIVARSNSGSGG